MKTASVAGIRERLTDYLAETARGPVIITDGDRSIAVLVAVSNADDAERLALALSHDLGALLDSRAAEFRRSGGLSHEEFWRQLDERYQSEGDDAGVRG